MNPVLIEFFSNWDVVKVAGIAGAAFIYLFVVGMLHDEHSSSEARLGAWAWPFILVVLLVLLAFIIPLLPFFAGKYVARRLEKRAKRLEREAEEAAAEAEDTHTPTAF